MEEDEEGGGDLSDDGGTMREAGAFLRLGMLLPS
jgi:hypothetical protein